MAITSTLVHETITTFSTNENVFQPLQPLDFDDEGVDIRTAQRIRLTVSRYAPADPCVVRLLNRFEINRHRSRVQYRDCR